mgnify:CR=1 FL=1
MREYKPKFDKDDNELVILDNLFDAECCMEYAKEHNMKVLMTSTTSTSSVEIMMMFQKNGFNHKLYEEDVFAPDGIKLSPKVLCLFEKSKVQEIINEI